MTDADLTDLSDAELERIRTRLCNYTECREHHDGLHPCPVPETAKHIDTDGTYNGWRYLGV